MARRPAGSRSLPSLLQSPEFVQLALAGVEREVKETRERLAKLEAYAEQLRRGTKAPAAPVVAARPKKGAKGANRLSPEARKALSERMRRKWAEYRKAKETATAKNAKK